MGKLTITVSGIMSWELMKCFACARYLKNNYPDRIEDYQFDVHFQTQWDLYLKQIQNEQKGDFYLHKGNLIVFVNGSQYIGGCDNFLEWAL